MRDKEQESIEEGGNQILLKNSQLLVSDPTTPHESARPDRLFFLSFDVCRSARSLLDGPESPKWGRANKNVRGN